MIYLGVDPGSQKTGWAVIEDLGFDWRLVDSGLIKTKASWSHVQFYAYLRQEILYLCGAHMVNCAAIESPFVKPGFRLDTAIVLGEVNGIIKLACYERGVDISVWPPKSTKKAISGRGNATKKQVKDAVKVLFGQDLGEHEADAVAVAVCLINATRAAAVARKEGEDER